MRLAGKLGLRRRQLGDGLVVLAELLKPPVRVLAAITAGRATSTPDGEVDFSTGLIEFLGNLCAGLPASYYQHSARQQLLRVTIAVGMNLLDTSWKVETERRDFRLLVQACCHDDVTRPKN